MLPAQQHLAKKPGKTMTERRTALQPRRAGNFRNIPGQEPNRLMQGQLDPWEGWNDPLRMSNTEAVKK